MSADPQQAADARFEEALAARGARDPREYYRERMRELKGQDPESYERATAFYRDELVPRIASGAADPIAAWLDFGCRLAEWSAPGDTVEVDATGRRHPHAPPTPLDRLVLHLPRERGARAQLVGLPIELSPAQRATYALLVQGRLKLR